MFPANVIPSSCHELKHATGEAFFKGERKIKSPMVMSEAEIAETAKMESLIHYTRKCAYHLSCDRWLTCSKPPLFVLCMYSRRLRIYQHGELGYFYCMAILNNLRSICTSNLFCIISLDLHETKMLWKIRYTFKPYRYSVVVVFFYIQYFYEEIKMGMI